MEVSGKQNIPAPGAQIPEKAESPKQEKTIVIEGFTVDKNIARHPAADMPAYDGDGFGPSSEDIHVMVDAVKNENLADEVTWDRRAANQEKKEELGDEKATKDATKAQIKIDEDLKAKNNQRVE